MFTTYTDEQTSFDCTIKFFDDPERFLEVESKYNQAFIDEMKEIVPPNLRKWNLGRKIWFIAPKYKQQIKDLAIEHFKTVEVIRGEA